ncbi:MAG: ATP-binding protein, partial [Candidatus Babeliales bacterium]
MFIPRDISKDIEKTAQSMPIIGIFGPRQSGKSTLAKKIFSKHAYVNFEDIETRMNAEKDGKYFLLEYANEYGIIIDEAQRVPDIFSYIQVVSDENPRPGYFILTGSQNYLLMQSISQSLAGRIALFTLLPFSIHELKSKLLPNEYETCIFTGFYPSIIAEKKDPTMWYKNYISTYVERDVRQLINVSQLSNFRKFMGLCAGRIGQLLNFSSLANDCGISVNTVKSWLSILETSYIIFLLQPHHKNFNKRLIKSPKLFFYDPGLACSILGIKNEKEIMHHYLRGGLFETMMISDLYKN